MCRPASFSKGRRAPAFDPTLLSVQLSAPHTTPTAGRCKPSLDLWKQSIPIERFLSKLTQRYALNSVLAASQSEGFEVAEQSVQRDGSIELVVTRWDA